jgi:predicted Zn-dependent peptidase
MAFRLFDAACYGLHPAGQPVIGNRANLKRFTRDDLQAWVAQHYSGHNVVVAAAGPVDEQAFVRLVEASFGAMPAGEANRVPVPAWHGGVKQRRMAGSGQCQVVLGHAAPPLRDPAHLHWVLAAALLGEGMSSPLLDEIRERRGLAYFASCSADIGALAGQFVIEAATAPEQAEELLTEVAKLLQQQAERIEGVALERARRQLAVRALRALEQPTRRLESAVQDVLALGQVRDHAAWLQALHAVSAAQVQAVFAEMQQRTAAVALAGSVPVRARDRALALFAPAGPAAPAAPVAMAA